MSAPSTREHLLEVGLERLRSTGYTATGVKEVLDLANVPKGSFYHYFPSKEAFAGEEFRWLAAPDGVLCYRRGADVTVVINTSARPVELPSHDSILAASDEVTGGVLPPDTGVWLRTRPPGA